MAGNNEKRVSELNDNKHSPKLFCSVFYMNPLLICCQCFQMSELHIFSKDVLAVFMLRICIALW